MINREYLNVISWEQVHADVYTLAERITSSGYTPDVIVGIGYGGIIPATLLYFALPEVRFRIAYPTASQHGVIEPLEGIEGKKVLLADDLAISGDSLMEIRAEIQRRGASEIAAACLYCSEDYHGLEHYVRRLLPGELMVFPWYARAGGGGVKVFKYKNRFGKHEPML